MTGWGRQHGSHWGTVFTWRRCPRGGKSQVTAPRLLSTARLQLGKRGAPDKLGQKRAVIQSWNSAHGATRICLGTTEMRRAHCRLYFNNRNSIMCVFKSMKEDKNQMCRPDAIFP